MIDRLIFTYTDEQWEQDQEPSCAIGLAVDADQIERLRVAGGRSSYTSGRGRCGTASRQRRIATFGAVCSIVRRRDTRPASSN